MPLPGSAARVTRSCGARDDRARDTEPLSVRMGLGGTVLSLLQADPRRDKDRTRRSRADLAVQLGAEIGMPASVVSQRPLQRCRGEKRGCDRRGKPRSTVRVGVDARSRAPIAPVRRRGWGQASHSVCTRRHRRRRIRSPIDWVLVGEGRTLTQVTWLFAGVGQTSGGPQPGRRRIGQGKQQTVNSLV